MANRKDPPDDMQPECDFSSGVKGKYAAAYREGTNVVVLDPDVAAIFPDSESVNDALRTLARVAKSAAGKKVA